MFVGPQLFPSLVLWEEKRCINGSGWEQTESRFDPAESDRRNIETTGCQREADGTVRQKVGRWSEKEKSRSYCAFNLRLENQSWKNSALQARSLNLGWSKPARQNFRCCSVPSLMLQKISQFQLLGTHLIILSTCVLFLSYSVFTFIWFYAGAKSLMFSPQTAHSRFFFPPRNCQTFIRQH